MTAPAPDQAVIALDAAAPDQRALLAAFRDNGAVSFQDVPLAQARSNYLASCRANGLASEAVTALEHHSCPVAGGSIALRLYRGIGWDAAAAAPSPVLFFIHGGGWVIGNLDSHDPLCRYLANHTGATVIAVDYRLAPEHPFPLPLHDCRDALAHVAAHAAAWRLDLATLVIAGDSAGGNMATLLANRADLRPAGLAVAAQVLLYPVTDLSPAASARASYRRVTAGFPLTAAAMAWFRARYLAPGSDGSDALLSPLLATGSAPQPPMFIVTVGLDPLADEGIAYAAKAAMAGGQVLHHHLPRHMHGIFTAAGKVATGRAMLAEAAAFVRRIAAATPPAGAPGLSAAAP